MKSPNILSDIVPVNNDQTLGTVWSPFKEGYFNKIIMSSGAGTNYDYDGSSNYTSMDLPEEEIKGAPAPSPWTSPENFFISGGSPGYWNRSDAGNRPGGHLGIRSGRNSYIEKSDGTFAETASKPGIGFYVSKFGTDHPAASGTAEIKFYGYDEIAVMDNNSIRVDRPLIPYTNEKTSIGDSSHNFREAYIKNVKGNADTATKVNSSLSVKDATGNSAITSWDGYTNETLVVGGTTPITATATKGKITITHDKKGPTTPTSGGDTTAQAPGFGETFKVTSATVDEYGHTTAFAEHEVTIPNSVATEDADGLMSSTDKTTLDNVADTYATKTEVTDGLAGKADTFTVTNGGNTASWGASVTVGSVAGTNLTFTMPSNPNTDTKNTAGSTNTTSKIYLIGATSQASNPVTYSNSSVFVDNGELTASKVHGAVFNDLADAIPVGEGDVLEAGYCYGFDGEHYTKTSDYLQKSYIGIHSDTFGFLMGNEEGMEKLNVAVAGFALAYVDKEYEVGTPLTCTADGRLTEIKFEDKIKYPERIVATYWKNEPSEEWGPENKKVRVNGRKWVKVK